MLQQTTCNIDVETSSRLDLTEVGADAYFNHPSTKLLMVAWKFRDPDFGPGKMQQWFPHLEPMPDALRSALTDPKIRKVAFNAAFEIDAFRILCGVDTPPEQWYDTMLMANACAMPSNLGGLMEVLLPHKPQFHKDKKGDALMRKFSYPNHKATWETHPVEFSEYAAYNRQDVVAEMKGFDVLLPYLETQMAELHHDWCLDWKINKLGLPIDEALADAALSMYDTIKAEFMAKLRKITGLGNPNSPKQLKEWLEPRGYPFESLGKDRVKTALIDFDLEIDLDAQEALRLRLDSTKSSILKFLKLKKAAVRGRMRNMFQFLGASRTGRWGGRLVQWQNVPRPWKGVAKYLREARQMLLDGDRESIEMLFDKTLEVMASLIRTVVKAPRGRKLVVADLSAIELCVVAWLTDCKFWLQVLAEGKDPYKAFGVYLWGVAYELLTKQQRDDSKPAVLGCAYRLGGGMVKGVYPDTHKTGLLGYAANLGVFLTQKFCKKAVKVYRELSKEVVDHWYKYDDAAMECVNTGQTVVVGPITFDLKKPYLRVRLPSGRYLFYCRPRIEMTTIMVPDEETGEERAWTKESVTFEQKDQQTGKWVRRTTHGGVFMENFVQAIARDILMFGMRNADNAGFSIIGHVHDEIICEEDKAGELGLDQLIHCMTAVELRPKWAKKIPIKTAGYENDFYKKD